VPDDPRGDGMFDCRSHLLLGCSTGRREFVIGDWPLTALIFNSGSFLSTGLRCDHAIKMQQYPTVGGIQAFPEWRFE
jgi:hypothetical protein